MESGSAANQQDRALAVPHHRLARRPHHLADRTPGHSEHLVYRDRLLFSQLHHRAPRRLTQPTICPAPVSECRFEPTTFKRRSP